MKNEIAALGDQYDIWDHPIDQVQNPGINIEKLSKFVNINMK